MLLTPHLVTLNHCIIAIFILDRNIVLVAGVTRTLLYTLDTQAPVVKDAPDVLDKQKCLDALAALRHAKWFQVCYFPIIGRLEKALATIVLMILFT